jgi:hypothetical protein
VTHAELIRNHASWSTWPRLALVRKGEHGVMQPPLQSGGCTVYHTDMNHMIDKSTKITRYASIEALLEDGWEPKT